MTFEDPSSQVEVEEGVPRQQMEPEETDDTVPSSAPRSRKRRRTNPHAEGHSSSAPASPSPSPSQSQPESQRSVIIVHERTKSTKLLDPNQTHEERAALRRTYRAMGERFQGAHRDELHNPASDALPNALHKLDITYYQTSYPSEKQCDFQVFNQLTHAGMIRAQKAVNVNMTSIQDFLQSLTKRFLLRDATEPDDDVEADEKYGPSQRRRARDDATKSMDWSRIGSHASSYLRSIHVAPHLYGAARVALAERKERKKGERKVVDEEEQKPEKLLTTEDEAKTQTDARVKALKALVEEKLRGNTWCNFYRFIINPNSFTQTIENMFDMGFLIKDGDVSISIDDETKEPCLRYMSKQANSEAYQNGGVVMMQCVMRYNMKLHEELISLLFPPGTPSMIPTRDESSGYDDGREAKRRRAKIVKKRKFGKVKVREEKENKQEEDEEEEEEQQDEEEMEEEEEDEAHEETKENGVEEEEEEEDKSDGQEEDEKEQPQDEEEMSEGQVDEVEEKHGPSQIINLNDEEEEEEIPASSPEL